MLAKCIHHNSDDFESEDKFRNYISKNKGFECDLKEKIFIVYAIQITENFPLLYVHKNENDSYSWPYYLPFFEIVDSRFSRYWDEKYMSGSLENLNTYPLNTVLAFSDWAKEGQIFYERLLDNDLEKKSIYQKYKALMDLEFAMPGIKEKAIDLGKENWLICPKCDESWQDENVSVHEMVKCPKCKTTWLSPVNEKKLS